MVVMACAKKRMALLLLANECVHAVDTFQATQRAGSGRATVLAAATRLRATMQ